MNALQTVLLSIAAAVLYGVLHDLVTAHLCVEYFTIGHPRIVLSESPAVLALVWGVLATWWVGLLLGIALAIAARVGRRPRCTAASLVRPIGRLLAWMAVLATVAGALGYALGSAGWIQLLGRLADAVPPDRHVRFLACLWAHSASYLVGFVGGGALALRTWRSRG